MYQPLAFIVLVSAVRAGREDYDKHIADDKRNSYLYEVLTPDGVKETKAGDLHAGMLIKVKQNDMVPVDMLFLGGQLPKGHCFIDKSNLNGMDVYVYLCMYVCMYVCRMHFTSVNEQSINQSTNQSINFHSFIHSFIHLFCAENKNLH
jgi:hypothetical protein